MVLVGTFGGFHVKSWERLGRLSHVLTISYLARLKMELFCQKKTRNGFKIATIAQVFQ